MKTELTNETPKWVYETPETEKAWMDHFHGRTALGYTLAEHMKFHARRLEIRCNRMQNLAGEWHRKAMEIEKMAEELGENYNEMPKLYHIVVGTLLDCANELASVADTETKD